MKYIILLLIGVALIVTVAPDKRGSTSNLDKTESTTSPITTPEVKAEEVKEPVKDTPKETPPPVDVVKDNPQTATKLPSGYIRTALVIKNKPSLSLLLRPLLRLLAPPVAS